MKTRFRLRRRAHKTFEQACLKHRRTIEAARGGRALFARVSANIRKVDTLFDRHLAAVNRAHARAQERLEEYERLRTTFRHIARITRIAARGGWEGHPIDFPRRISTLEFVSWAEGVLSILSKDADVLERYGLSALVLHDLPRRLALLRTVQTDRSLATIDHVVTNSSIQTALRATDDAILSLETSLATTPGVSPRIVAELRAARRVGRAPRGTGRPRRA